MLNHDPTSEYSIRLSPLRVGRRQSSDLRDLALRQGNMLEDFICSTSRICPLNVALAHASVSALRAVEKYLTPASAFEVIDFVQTLRTLASERTYFVTGISVGRNNHIIEQLEVSGHLIPFSGNIKWGTICE